MKRILFFALVLIMPLRAVTSTDAETALNAEYAAQTGTAITIIFDNSGSMEGAKLKEAKQAFRWWLEKAPDGYTWSLINFDGNGKILVPFAPNAKEKIASAVNAQKARTNTPIANSLRLARKQIEEYRGKVAPYQRQVVLLFTDGQENQDSGGGEAVLQTIREMRALNIEVVGIGFHGEGDYLGKASTRYYPADDEEQLRSGLGKVDAEIDLGGEVNVTPEDLKAMGAADEKTAKENALEHPAMPPAENKSGGSRWLIIFATFALIYFFFRIMKATRKR